MLIYSTSAGSPTQIPSGPQRLDLTDGVTSIDHELLLAEIQAAQSRIQSGEILGIEKLASQFVGQPASATLPEPTSLALLAFGGMMIARLRRP